MNLHRENQLKRIRNEEEWDIIVIGGGASGLSTGWDACSRDLKVLLIEAGDFSSATSSRSTKLIHGGVRYLQNFEIDLVKEALEERHLLLKNAPEFCKPLRFTLPVHSKLSAYYYRTGLVLYDKLATFDGEWCSAKMLDAAETLGNLPNLKLQDLAGAVEYSDAQFDDTGLSIALYQAIEANGGTALNYARAKSLQSSNGILNGITIEDQETGEELEVKGKIFINATGIFSSVFRAEQECGFEWNIAGSRGSHIVTKSNVLSSKQALIIPKTSDGRVLFALPWMNHTVIGTTDVATEKLDYSPSPSFEEIEFLLREANNALGVSEEDVCSQWSGIRPLVHHKDSSPTNTKSISRKHVIELSNNGLISLLGGKWTTARNMAEDVIDVALSEFGISGRPSNTKDRQLTKHGALPPIISVHNPDRETPSQQNVEFLVNHTAARTIEDVLARRFRTAFLCAREAQKLTIPVSHWMAKALGWSETKRIEMVEDFKVFIAPFVPLSETYTTEAIKSCNLSSQEL